MPIRCFMINLIKNRISAFLRPRMFGRGEKCWGEHFLDGVCDPSLIISQKGMDMEINMTTLVTP